MNEEKMVITSGVTFKFIVMPSISKFHQEELRFFIIKKSGLSQYFRNIDVSFYDGCCIDTDGATITDDKLNGKQMVVKVFCPEPIIVIEKNKEMFFTNR